MEFEIRVNKTKHSNRLVLPKEIADSLGLQSGDELEIELRDNEMLMRKKA